MAKVKCPMAGIGECVPACMWYEKDGCGLLIALKDCANGLGAIKSELKMKPKEKK